MVNAGFSCVAERVTSSGEPCRSTHAGAIQRSLLRAYFERVATMVFDRSQPAAAGHGRFTRVL